MVQAKAIYLRLLCKKLASTKSSSHGLGFISCKLCFRLYFSFLLAPKVALKKGRGTPPYNCNVEMGEVNVVLGKGLRGTSNGEKRVQVSLLSLFCLWQCMMQTGSP